MRNFTRATALAMLAAATVAAVGGTAAATPSVSDDATAVVSNSESTTVAVDAATENPANAATQPTDPGTEYMNAFTAITGAFANDSTVGRVVGTGIGLAVGCPLGAVTGGSLTLAVPVLTPIGIIGGCIIGGSTLGFLGGTVGSIVSGSPAMANAFGQQYNSLHSKGLIAEPLPNSETDR